MKTTLKTDIKAAVICDGFVTYVSGGNNLEEVRLSSPKGQRPSAKSEITNFCLEGRTYKK